MAQVILITDHSGFMRAMGAYQVASWLRSNGYTVQVIDFQRRLINMGFSFFLNTVKKFLDKDTLWVGFSSTFAFQDGFQPWQNITSMFLPPKQAREFREFVHSINPKCKIVVGGSRAKYFDHPEPRIVDVYIGGYAEITALEYTKHCAGQNPFLVAQQNKDGSISINNNLTAAGFDYTNYRFRWDESDAIHQNEALPVEISRGCIFKCSFCAYPLHGRKKLDYLKDPAILRDHFTENYERFGTTHYLFMDDTHNDNVEKLRILHDDVFAKLPFQIKFASYLRLDLLNAHPETIPMLKENGLVATFLGIESLNHPSSKSIGKGIPTQKAIDTLSNLKYKWPDVSLIGGFIIGLPHESEATARKWLTTITNKGFPLDGVKQFALRLNHPIDKAARNWYSELELNPEKYGYTFDRDGNWTNSEGLTHWKALELEKEFNKRAEDNGVNKRIGMAARVAVSNYGISEEDAKSINPNDYVPIINAAPGHKAWRRFDRYVKKITGDE